MSAGEFRFAPEDWNREAALRLAEQQGLALTPDHWDVIGALQEYYARQQGAPVRRRALHDALEERFHHKGGLRYLYMLFPGGPLAQGCRVAGLEPPAGSFDPSYGSVA